jgi:pSer/pThr/pTyr-binding forkhead associated (FHA) protein
MMVFDKWQNEIPITFIVIRKCQENDLQPILQSLSQKLPNDRMLSAIIVDKAEVEINILK